MIIAICIVFILGYAAIAMEHPIRINKAASALVTAALCWSIYALFSGDAHAVSGTSHRAPRRSIGNIVFPDGRHDDRGDHRCA